MAGQRQEERGIVGRDTGGERWEIGEKSERNRRRCSLRLVMCRVSKNPREGDPADAIKNSTCLSSSIDLVWLINGPETRKDKLMTKLIAGRSLRADVPHPPPAVLQADFAIFLGPWYCCGLQR